MATVPTDSSNVIDRFGPHLAYAHGTRVDPGAETEKLVKTHCCFCGQQCGIQLKVRDNTVIGFEPWMEFPFNQGKLCPKGVKRYLQGAHPDRLVSAYRKDSGYPNGFAPIAYADAIARTASETDRIQKQYGAQAVACLSGAS